VLFYQNDKRKSKDGTKYTEKLRTVSEHGGPGYSMYERMCEVAKQKK